MTDRKDQEMPLLSVTVLNYNYAHYLAQCLDSILNQTFSDFELIVINDSSTDNSLDVIEAFIKDPRVRSISHASNRGYVESLLEGVELSRGKYITVISADDFCVSTEALATLMKMLVEDEKTVFAYSAHGYYDSTGRRHHLRLPSASSRSRSGIEEFRNLVLECYVLHSGTIIRRDAYDAVGGYDPNARYAVDYKLWLLLCSQGNVAYCADELYAYRVHDASMAHSMPSVRQNLQETIEGIQQGFSLLHPLLDDRDVLWRRALRTCLVAVPTYDIFGGRVLRGWYAYWVALCAYPVATFAQKRTLVLVLRTVLGGTLYNATLRTCKRGVSLMTTGRVQYRDDGGGRSRWIP